MREDVGHEKAGTEELSKMLRRKSYLWLQAGGTERHSSLSQVEEFSWCPANNRIEIHVKDIVALSTTFHMNILTFCSKTGHDFTKTCSREQREHPALLEEKVHSVKPKLNNWLVVFLFSPNNNEINIANLYQVILNNSKTDKQK